MTRVIGFDLDDTLLPEVLFLRSGIHHIAPLIHDTYSDIPLHRVITRMETAVASHQNHYSALESLLDDYGVYDRDEMKLWVSEFRNHLPDPEIYHLPPSRREVLEKLKMDTDTEIVLITDGRSTTQRNKIYASGLDTFFRDSDIYISEETGYDKTHPDSFLQVMERYAGASEYHYIGDNPMKDFIHPSRLGWMVHQTRPFPLMIHRQGMPR